MKGLDTCFAYRIEYDGTREKHTCIALEHRASSDKPQCVGEKRAKECAFFRTHTEYSESTYRSALRNIHLGLPLDEQQSEQLKLHRMRGQRL